MVNELIKLSSHDEENITEFKACKLYENAITLMQIRIALIVYLQTAQNAKIFVDAFKLSNYENETSRCGDYLKI